MLPFNPDIMNTAVAEHQERVRIAMMRANLRQGEVNLFRKAIGHLLVWSGRRVGGLEIETAPEPQLAPVIDLGSRWPAADRDLERAA